MRRPPRPPPWSRGPKRSQDVQGPTKEHRKGWPKNPEDFRATIKTLGLGIILLELRFPNKAVLRTAGVGRFTDNPDNILGSQRAVTEGPKSRAPTGQVVDQETKERRTR